MRVLQFPYASVFSYKKSPEGLFLLFLRQFPDGLDPGALHDGFKELFPAGLAALAADVAAEGDPIAAAVVLFRQQVLEIQPGDLGALGEGPEGGGHIIRLGAVGACLAVGGDDPVLDPLKDRQGHQDQHHAAEGDEIVPGAGGQAQAGHGPDRGGGGEALDAVALPQDGAGTQKAHAGDHLGSQTGRVGQGPKGGVLDKDQLGRHHDGAGTQGNQGVGPHTGRAAGIFPLGTDHQTDGHGAQKPQQDLPGGQIKGRKVRHGVCLLKIILSPPKKQRRPVPGASSHFSRRNNVDIIPDSAWICKRLLLLCKIEISIAELEISERAKKHPPGVLFLCLCPR